ncbi:MAG: SGNH/GDSL hydrolase family protein [Planctomycetaceae bacterium]|nr:SGNH/GDSL hydrolase family protein [Planctomycetaceae bacterium]
MSLIFSDRNNFFGGKVFRVWLLISFSFFLGETVFRIRAIVRFGQIKSTMIVDDPVEGRYLQPNVVSEGTLRAIHINEHGTRGKSFLFDRPDAVIRIACLGSSTVFGGTANSDDETFPAWLEKILNRRLETINEGKRVEVLNAGVPGMGTGSVQKHLERRIRQFRPQIAVFYAVPNDIGSIVRARTASSKPPHFLKRWRQDNSVMYNALREKVKFYSPGIAASQFSHFPKSGEASFEKLYDDLFQSCQKLQIVPVAVSHSVAFRKEQPPREQNKMLFGDFWGLGLQGAFEAVETMNKTMQNAAARNNVLFIDGENCIPGSTKYFGDAVHLRPAGNEKLAEKIAEKLLEHDVLTPFLRNDIPVENN